MTEIVIRPYEEQDWARIEEIHDAARKLELEAAGLTAAFVPLKQAAVDEGLFDYTVCVAQAGDRVEGFVAYSEGEIAWLYVSPESMRRGVGRSLVLYAIENITKRPVELEVLTGNNAAVHFYEAMGFVTTEFATGKMPGNETFRVTVHCMQRG